MNETGAVGNVDFSPFGSFLRKWVEDKCKDGEVMVGMGVEISEPFFVTASPLPEGKMRAPLQFRLKCAKK